MFINGVEQTSDDNVLLKVKVNGFYYLYNFVDCDMEITEHGHIIEEDIDFFYDIAFDITTFEIRDNYLFMIISDGDLSFEFELIYCEVYCYEYINGGSFKECYTYNDTHVLLKQRYIDDSNTAWLDYIIDRELLDGWYDEALEGYIVEKLEFYYNDENVDPSTKSTFYKTEPEVAIELWPKEWAETLQLFIDDYEHFDVVLDVRPDNIGFRKDGTMILIDCVLFYHEKYGG